MEGPDRRLRLLLVCAWVMTAYHVVARIGLAIDLQWHTDVGRDSFLTPPHLMIIAGFPPTLLLCLLCLLRWTQAHRAGKAVDGLRLGPLVAPAPIWLTLVGIATIPVGAVFDDYWHAQYGIDVMVLTPPHLLTLAGGMLAELAAVVLVVDLRRRIGDGAPRSLEWLGLLSLWALFYHLHLAASHFLDPRGATLTLGQFGLLLHPFVAGLSVLFVLVIAQRCFPRAGGLRFAALALAMQVLFLLAIHPVVAALMGPEHVYRPGSPHTNWAAASMPWLMLPLALLLHRLDLWRNRWALPLGAVCIDATWWPVLPTYQPSEVGIGSAMMSFALALGLLVGSYPALLRIVDRLQNLSVGGLHPLIVFSSGSRRAAALAVGLCILLLPAGTAGAHEIHRVEEGDGFDAPRRMLIDIEEQEVWVEFMLWPPKAMQAVSVMLVVGENTTREIDALWIELVHPSDSGEVRMVVPFERHPGNDVWTGEVHFPFAGAHVVEVWMEVEGLQGRTEIPLKVEAPAAMPVWLAWTVSGLYLGGILFGVHDLARRMEVAASAS